MTQWIFTLLIIAILVVLFLAFRQAVLWYYKIDKRLEAQELTNLLLKDIIKELKSDEKFEKETENINDSINKINDAPEEAGVIIIDNYRKLNLPTPAEGKYNYVDKNGMVRKNYSPDIAEKKGWTKI
jgi:hypothetical protein